MKRDARFLCTKYLIETSHAMNAMAPDATSNQGIAVRKISSRLGKRFLFQASSVMYQNRVSFRMDGDDCEPDNIRFQA